jgi:uncharacterized protein
METKKIFVISFLIILSFSALFVLIRKLEKTNEVCINENCFQVEIAETPSEKQQGLMFRKSLDEDKGMLFVYEEDGYYSFWMKNTLIPLDIIWINQTMDIIYFVSAVPCNEEICVSYLPNEKAKYVLEINTGIIKDFSGKVSINLAK